MNEIKIFEGTQVHIIEVDGEPLFEVYSIGMALGQVKIAKGQKYPRKDRIDENLKSAEIMPVVHNGQLFITEEQLYDLMLEMKTDKVKPFRKWLTSEVLPSIRKHGAYMTPETLEKALTSPDFLIQLATKLKDTQNHVKQLKLTNSQLTVDNQIMQPKAEYFDELVDRNLLLNFTDTAKELGIKRKVFIQFLLDKKYIYRDKNGALKPYANKNSGLFELKESMNDKTNWSGTQTLITPKGRETFRLLLLA